MTRLITRITFLILSALLVGCSIGRPAIPEAVSHSSIIYKTTDLEKHRCLFEEAMTGQPCLNTAGRIETHTPMKDEKMAAFWRDTMINSIRRDIESYYHEYETQLADGRRRFGSLIEVTALAGVAATTISKGERARTVIATMVSFLQGGRNKIDQDIFRDRTTDVIIQKMRASRANIETMILHKMAADVARYGFSEAERDLRELFWAGTLQGGFLELSLSAGADAAQAAEKRNNAEVMRIATPQDRVLAKKIDDKITGLAQIWQDNQNTPTGKGALQTLLDALRALKERNKLNPASSLPEDISKAKELIALIRSEVADTRDLSEESREKLNIIAEALGVR